MDLINKIAEGVQLGNAPAVRQAVETLIREGLAAQEILDRGLFAGMTVVGRLFKEEEIFMPEVIMSAKAMQAGVDLLEPLLLAAGGRKAKGKIILGTVKGDLHDLGKNLVGLMLRGAGYEVIDLGVDVTADRFVGAVREKGAQVVAMSALLTTTMPQMGVVVEALKEAGLGERVKTIIGGCVITQDFADRIGADGYAENAGEAVDKINQLLAG